MFCGTELKTEVEDFVSRSTRHDENDAAGPWTFYKIVLRRHRYGDQADVAIDVELTRAKNPSGRFELSQEKPEFTWRVRLGNLNDPRVRSRLRTNDGDRDEPKTGNPKIIAELKSAVSNIKIYAEHCAKLGLLFDNSEADRYIREACEKPLVLARQAA